MIQRRERFGFARESRQAVSVMREGVGQDLDRDIPIQLDVASAKDLAHAALADLRGDVVDAKTCAEGETQTTGSIAVSVARTRLNPG